MRTRYELERELLHFTNIRNMVAGIAFPGPDYRPLAYYDGVIYGLKVALLEVDLSAEGTF